MINIPGYSIAHTVYEDPYLLVAFALSEPSAEQVLLKIVKSGKNTMIENAKLIHEYNFLKELDMEGLFRPNSYMNHKNMMILEYEPIYALTLRDYWSKAIITSDRCVQIFKRVIMRLHQLHQRNILHLNIRPDTLLIQQYTDNIYLTGFGYAIHLDERGETGQGSLEGNPVYMSPEQTGRMNGGVDVRADIYSLGMTFYELMAGQLPFTAGGALGWAHAHLARTPIPLTTANPAVPPAISEIVMRMLAKDPGQRYAGMGALLEQLENCSGPSIEMLRMQAPHWFDSKEAAAACERIDLPEEKYSAALHSMPPAGTGPVDAYRPSLVINDNIVSYPQVLDLAAVVQASQIFSEASSGEQIAAQLMQLIATNAGAQRGLLLLPYAKDWFVDLEIALTDRGMVSELPHLPLEAYSDIPHGLIASSIGEKMILQGAGAAELPLQGAHYSDANRGGSTLRMPILVQDQLQGLLYIENRLTSRYFAPERLSVLRNLASQALFVLKSRPPAMTLEAGAVRQEPAARVEGYAELRHSLTPREQEVLQLLARGLSNKEIADSLTITSETVKTHLKNIFGKLKVDRRMKAAAIAKTIGLLDDRDP